ncbi:MAG: hypothetical protein JSU87_13345 [Gemmatimonadota bacterium]|nr:MAG: hypothetical protein JSU87_13345 [Gemmatimonadota bacterium]
MAGARFDRAAATALSLYALLFVQACEVLSDIRALQTLGKAIEREFKADKVSLNLDNTHLDVVLVNSPLADVPQDEQRLVARRVAEYVRDQYSDYPALETIRVEFTWAFEFAFARVERSTSYPFETAELRKATEHADSLP